MKSILFSMTISICINISCSQIKNITSCVQIKNDGLINSDTTTVFAHYPKAIEETKNDFFTVRSKTESEKTALFQKSKALFPLSQAIDRISTITNPQVIVWFTDYCGQVTKKNIDWYKKNIFLQLPTASFWITDLSAWQFLSADKRKIEKSYPKLIEKIKTTGLTREECPLTQNSSKIVPKKEIEAQTNFKVLASKSFFQWLLTYPDPSLLSNETCEQFCRNIVRPESLGCSLSQLGYKPPLLDRYIKRLGTNMLDADFSLIYPVLQYLEAVYYASEIIATQSKEKEHSIIFLLPNKEFTYFTVPGEITSFSTFNMTMSKLFNNQNSLNNNQHISIFFEPFCYGKDFYDAPYRLGGTRCKHKALIKALNNK